MWLTQNSLWYNSTEENHAFITLLGWATLTYLQSSIVTPSTERSNWELRKLYHLGGIMKNPIILNNKFGDVPIIVWS